MTEKSYPRQRSATRSDGRKCYLLRYPERQPTIADEELFHRCHLPWEGRFDFEYYDDDVIDTLMDLRWRGKTLADQLGNIGVCTDRVIFDVTSTLDVCASAKIRNRVGMIGISIGLIARMYRIAYALLTLPDVVSDAGIAEVNSPDFSKLDIWDHPKSVETVLPKSFYGESPPSMVFATIAPKEYNRRWLAHSVCGILFQWVWYHEWFHICSGHIECGNRELGIQSFELHDSEHEGFESHLDFDMSQLMEADADRRASWRIADEIVGDGLLLEGSTKDRWSVGQRLQGFAFVQAVLFWLISTEAKGIEGSINNRQSSHPHPLVRFLWVYSRIEYHLKEQQMDEWVDLYFSGLQKANRLLRQFAVKSGLSVPKHFESSPENSEAITDEVNALIARLPKTLYPLTKRWDYAQILINEDSDDSR
jgi:hypothetical protein